MSVSTSRGVRAATVAAALYALLAGGYIWFSDAHLFGRDAASVAELMRLSVLKGTLFVVVTASGLFLLVWRLSLRVERAVHQEASRAAAAIFASEERYRALAEFSTDFIFMFDAHARLVYLNRAAAQELGEPVEALHGRVVEELFPAEVARRQREAVERVVAQGESEIGEGVVSFPRRALWLSTSFVPMRDLVTAQVTGVIAVARDITPFKRQAAVREATLAIAQAANSATSLDELLPQIHRAVGELLPADNFSIALYDQEREVLSYPYFVDEVQSAPSSRPLGRGLTELVLRRGRSLRVTPEVFARLVAEGEVDLVGPSATDWLGVPLKLRERPMGVLVVQSYREGVNFDESTQELLEFVSSQVAMAIERTRAEEALRDSEERFRVLVETAPVGVFIIVGDTIVYANPGAARITGYSRSEMIGSSFVIGVHPEHRTLIAARAFARQEGTLAADEYEIKVITKGGEERWIHGSSGRAQLWGGPALVTTFFDVTAHRRAEEEREESRRMLRLVLDTIPVRVFWKDRESRYLGCNRLFAQDAGLESSKEVVGKTDFEMGWREQAELYRRDDAEVMSRGQAKLNYEEPQTTPSGAQLVLRTSKVPLRGPDGTILGVLGTYEDITDRKRAEEAIRESEERYRTLVELSPDAIVIHDGATILFINERGVQLLGYTSAAEVVGRAIQNFVHPDDHALVRQRVQRAFADGRPLPPMVERFLRADGTTIEGEVVAAPLEYCGRRVMQVVVRDLSERRAMEEQLRQAQKLEAIGQLAGGVAHDFNNLLQALLSTTQVLRARHPQPLEVAQGLEELEVYARRGAALARQLLLFARREVTRLELVDLNEVVGGTANLLRRLLPENVALDLQLAGKPLPVRADRGQLEQVLVNLAVNAREAMSRGGILRVCTGDEAGEVWLKVVDTGCGIPRELLGRVFEPFFTTKPAGEGSGLGLAVVHGIAVRHGGKVELWSEVGQGASFRLVLPRAVGKLDARSVPVAEVVSDFPAGQGARVLLVEDENGAREGIRDALHLLGYQVVAVASAEEALAQDADGPFDVLLSDLLLPGMHGGELAELLRGRWPKLKVIIMSGYAWDEASRLGVGEGTVRFLQKPFDLQSLAAELRRALEE